MDSEAPFVADADIDVRLRNRPYRHDGGGAAGTTTASGQGKIKDQPTSTDEQTSLLESERSGDSIASDEGSEDEADRGPADVNLSELAWWRKPSVRMCQCLE